MTRREFVRLVIEGEVLAWESMPPGAGPVTLPAPDGVGFALAPTDRIVSVERFVTLDGGTPEGWAVSDG